MPEGSVVSWLLPSHLHRPNAKVGQTGNHRPVSTISDSPRGTKQASTRPSLETHARSTPPRPPVIYRTSDHTGTSLLLPHTHSRPQSPPSPHFSLSGKALQGALSSLLHIQPMQGAPKQTKTNTRVTSLTIQVSLYCERCRKAAS